MNPILTAAQAVYEDLMEKCAGDPVLAQHVLSVVITLTNVFAYNETKPASTGPEDI